jgi:hypothetical protein
MNGCPRSLLCALAASLAATLSPAQAAEQRASPSLVVLPFEIEDTSGEVGPANRHDAGLSRLTTLVREEIAAAQLYRVVPQDATDKAVAAVNSGTFLRNCNGCELDIARRAGADDVLIGWIYKVSTLVLSQHIEIKDAATGKILYARAFDFRGDNEPAYAHAAKTLVRSLKGELTPRAPVTLAAAEGAAPIKIAVFDFELDDPSAGGGVIAQDATDADNLKKSTEEARTLLSASGRYSPVDTGSAGAGAFKDCNGCEAALAKKLGAAQSMAGVVRRVSRTEYTMQVVVRDAATGEVVTNAFTGLRMGANYSWPRGAKWLMDRQILVKPASP